MIKTDILIIGAGPCGLFTVFEAGLARLHCHLIDYLPQPGGQCAEIYPKKPIYDIPGFPSILAGDLVDNLMEQAAPFKPGFTLGERAETIEKLEDGMFKVTTDKGTEHMAPVIAIAGGLGCFAPRKPQIENLADFENKGIEYIIKDPEVYRDKKVAISGGGDSALDWAIYLSDVASEVTLIHRRTEFRGAADSAAKVEDLSKKDGFTLYTNTEVKGLKGNGSLRSIQLQPKDEDPVELEVDHWLPLFGLTPKLGPIADWGLNLNRNAIIVDPLDYSTNVEGIYAIGDINEYPGKLKLILCGFHEATIMVHAAHKYIYPDQKLALKYTTVNGVQGFDD